MCLVKLDNDLFVIVDVSFFRLLKFFVFSWFKILGNILAIFEKNINKSIKICVCCLIKICRSKIYSDFLINCRK